MDGALDLAAVCRVAAAGLGVILRIDLDDVAVFVLLAAAELGDLVLEVLYLLGHAGELQVVQLGGLDQGLESGLGAYDLVLRRVVGGLFGANLVVLGLHVLHIALGLFDPLVELRVLRLRLLEGLVIGLHGLVIGILRLYDGAVTLSYVREVLAGQIPNKAGIGGIVYIHAVYAQVPALCGGVLRIIDEVASDCGIARSGEGARNGLGIGVYIGVVAAAPVRVLGKLLYERALLVIAHLAGIIGQLGLVCGGLEGIEGVGAGAFDVAAGGRELVGEALVLVLGGLVAQLGELDLLRRADVGVALGYGLLQLLLRAGDLAAAAAHVDELLLVGVLRVVQLGLEVLELAALARG